MMEKKVIDFAHSESDSSFGCESPRTARGNAADDADGYESDEYGAFKDHLRSGVDFRSIPPPRSSRSIAPSFSKQNSSGVTERRGDTGSKEDVAFYASFISVIDAKVKGHVGRLLRATHMVSAQIARLEDSSNQFEGLVNSLKDSTEFYYRKTERRLRELEDMATEVQSSIKDLKDKQTIAEVQLQLAMVEQTRVDLQSKQQNMDAQNKVVQPQVSSAHSQNHQPYPSPVVCQQNLSSHYSPQPQNPLQMPANTATSIPQQQGQSQPNFIQQYQTCTRAPQPTLDCASQQQHMFLTQSSETQYQPYMRPSFPESSQLPHPQTPYSTLRTSINQVHHQAPQRPYMPLHQHPGKVNVSDYGARPPLDYRSSTMKSDYSTRPPLDYRSSTVKSDYGARPPLDYWSSTTKASQPPLPSFSPTPKALPRAIPMAVDVTEASSSGGSESKAPIEDIIENAVAMGFRRNAVKATVKKLTENGQQVDFNVVLDKLINSGEPQ